MALSYNNVTLLGRLGKDPEVRSTPSGKKVCTLTLATSESYKDKTGNWQETTDWHRIVLWEYKAETAEKHLRKGSKVMIEGKLKTRSYEDQSGVTKYITEVLGSNIVLIDSSASGGGGNSGPIHAGESSPNYESFESKDSSDEFDDDVPF